MKINLTYLGVTDLAFASSAPPKTQVIFALAGSRNWRILMRTSDVFTPNIFPEHTYVARDNSRTETILTDALDNPGYLVSLAGPSKAGKTALVEKTVGSDNLITITGAGIASPRDLWTKVLRWMEQPVTGTTANQTQLTGTLRLGASGSVGFLGTGVTATGDVSGGLSSTGSQTDSFDNANLAKIIHEIGGSPFILLIDDYHYILPQARAVIAQELKEAVRQGVKIVTATLPHHADETIRANPDLTGRVTSIDLKYWSTAELKQIATLGLPKLGISFSPELTEVLARSASGSPQLMQQILLTTCKAFGINETQEVERHFESTGVDFRDIFQRVAMNTDQASLVNKLTSGPKTRGTERRDYNLINGQRGDVYKVLFTAIIADPSSLAFSYDDLRDRVTRICIGETPTGSSLIGACQHVAGIASIISESSSVEWDESHETLYIRDPYLMFYLRWSEKMIDYQPE